MTKKIFKNAIYYISVPIIFYLCIVAFSAMIPDNASLGVIGAAIYLFLLVAVPVLTALLMRFSSLPWVLDPFAAAELPLFMLCAMVLKAYGRSGDISRAFAELRLDLGDDGGMGYLIFGAWFVFALICTFSLRRPKGEGLCDRIIAFFTKKTEEE